MYVQVMVKRASRRHGDGRYGDAGARLEGAALTEYMDA